MKILLVEDDEVAMFILQRMIGKLGHTAVCCSNGEQAIRMLDEFFDLVITDWMLPNMTGLELSEKINSSQKKLPVLLISGMPDKVLEEKAAKPSGGCLAEARTFGRWATGAYSARLARASTASNSTWQPASASSGSMLSASLCESPSLQGVKIIAVGTLRAT